MCKRTKARTWRRYKTAWAHCNKQLSSQIMHMLPELHRTDNGDALISFRSGVANIQFKINCYCGHKKEKEGFVIRFDSQSDASIASHVTLPLMFYHQNKNRVASRALAAAAKAQAKTDQQEPSAEQGPAVRNVVKSVTSKTKRESRSKTGNSPIGNQQHQIPSPPNSLLDSPLEWSSSPEMDDFIDSSDIPFTVPSPPPPDPLISLFPDSTVQEQHQQQQPIIALISHMTPNSGPVRGGTLVTIHGTGFTVGEVMYVCFGENMIPIIPQRDHMLECITPASNKAETVPVFAMNATESGIAQATFTYVDDNEKELIKLALQRMMNISVRMEGPLDNVLNRANEFTLWSDLLEGSVDSSSTPSSLRNTKSYMNLEDMVLDSFEILDTPAGKNLDGLSIVNSTGHTMLHLAVWLEYEALTKDLLARGVDTVAQDKNGLTALDWARRLDLEAMVALLTGDIASSLPESASALLGGKLALAAEHDEVARGLQSSVSPGSQPTATDQPNVDSSHGGIAVQAGIPLSQLASKDIALDLDIHMEPHMDVQWESFGQGPGNDVNGQGKVVDGLFVTQHAENFFVQQARKDASGPAHGESVSQNDAQYSQVHQQQEQDRPQYRKTWSAIPTGSVDESTALAPVQDGNSPTPLCRLLIGGSVAQVGSAGSIEEDIPILNPAITTCPIDSGPDPSRQPVGDLDRIAPLGQDMVAIEGCTYAEPKSTGIVSRRVQSNGSIQNIQSTARIDEPTQDARALATFVVGAFGQQHQQQDEVMSDDSVPQEDQGVVIVDGVDHNAGGSINSARQAVVQSSRDDVESEPLLFLGGQPVTLGRVPRMESTTTSVNTALSRSEEQQQEQQEGSSGDDEEVDAAFI